MMTSLPSELSRLLRQFSASLWYPGIVAATLFYAISLSPSLLPRPYLLQGLLSGFALIAGYCVGVVCMLVWRYAELPHLNHKAKKITHVITMIICVAAIALATFYANSWQNDLRDIMGLPSDISGNHIKVALIALVLAFTLLMLGRVLAYAFKRIARRLKHYIPPRIANLISGFIVLISVLYLSNDLAIQNLVNNMDDIYAAADAYTDEGVEAPSHALASGSRESFIDWHSLGRTGQNFVTQGPSQADIAKHFPKRHVQQPLRVYVGLRSADTAKARAQLALKELIRVGGFERPHLIIATPTGTGWLDPSAVDSLEYVHAGATAIVTMQYSYLPSWLTLTLNPRITTESARALYDAIHGHWTTLPTTQRPKLYVHGLSLGALGAETSIDIASLIRDPIHGGVLAGAPFPSLLSPQLQRNRNPGSPQWLPIVNDSSFVRFTAQDNALDIKGAEWGPMRFVYIQYASDPMVFFSEDLYRKEPDWLKGERGHDVSPALQWFPIVTFLQILFDLPMADRVPKGVAHNYAAKSYIDAWVAVTQPAHWNDAETARLKLKFKGR